MVSQIIMKIEYRVFLPLSQFLMKVLLFLVLEVKAQHFSQLLKVLGLNIPNLDGQLRIMAIFIREKICQKRQIDGFLKPLILFVRVIANGSAIATNFDI